MSLAEFNQQAASLLNFDDKFDVSLLDYIVSCAYNPMSPYFAASQNVLVEFQEHPNSWTRVDAVLEYSTLDASKFLALNILQSLIRIRWKALPRDQCENIKKYVVGYVTKCSSDDEALLQTRDFRVKLDQTLVSIVKQEWPQYWPSFIPDIVGASKTNLALCENNMIILKLLSEEVFDFSSGKMTQAKAKHLKQQMCNEFTQIFDLCSIVLSESNRPSLVLATLHTLQSFLSWIPLGYIFETPLIPMLIENFLPVPEYQNITLKCLGEIGGLNTNNMYEDLFISLFTQVMNRVSEILPQSGLDLNELYQNSSSEEQSFVQNLTLFLTGFFREHVKILESRSDLHPLLIGGHLQLVMISEVEETELFKVCLEYWNSLALSLYSENPYSVSTTSAHQPLLLNGGGGMGSGSGRQLSPRRELYAQVLSKVRAVMITRMAKPEEVLVVEDNDEIIREHVKDTDSINIYKSARETLVYLTHLDSVDTESIMTRKLMAQVDQSEWSWKNLNTLCWAIGSISGAMNEDDEKRFLVTVIRELLGLCEFKRGKENKAVIASNIMYIVGQYPRFLRAHWKFLKTVVQKLFEFMHESHEGVQDMACDTFIKIAQKCRRHFVTLQTGEDAPYIDRLLQEIPMHISDLTNPQQQTFFEAVGYMISAQMEPMTRDRLIEKFMQIPTNIWDNIIGRAIQSVEVFREPETVRGLIHALRLNIRACVAIGHPFVSQLGKIYLDMLNVYSAVSGIINETIRAGGEITTTHMTIKNLMTVKTDILKLFESWVCRSEDPALVVERFLPPLLEAILLDYQNSVPAAREPEVLKVLTTMITTVKDDITNAVPAIFDAVFGCTLDMINKDLQEFPEHRTNFFLFLKAINQHSFISFFRIPAEQFQLVINSIVWAIQHTMRDVADTGLTILNDLLIKVGRLEDENISQTFYQTYFLTLMQHVFVVLTDSSHAAGFKMHATILATMFELVNSDIIKVPLYDTTQYTNLISNKDFFCEFISLKLKEAFPHLVPNQIDMIVKQLATLYTNLPAFKNALRDFLIQIKEIQNEDDLFLEEKEIQQQLETAEKQQFHASVPGILKPGERDDMADVANYEDHELEVYEQL